MTVIEIVNKVLRRLREDQITSLSETDYAEMVTDFVVDIHKELLDYDWSSMEHTINVPVDANQRVLDLSRNESDGGDVTDASRVPTVDSIPIWAKVFDSSSTALGFPIDIALPEDLDSLYYEYTTQRALYPSAVSFRASPDRAGLEALLYPVPSVARHLRVRMWTPEDEIDTTTDATRTLLVPWKPIYLGALYLALNERGEEVGEPGGLAERRYAKAAAEAKEADQVRKNNGGLYVAERQ